MYRLENTVRDYPWGSRTLIAELLGHEPPAGPEAEMWIGAHPVAPSRILVGQGPEGTEAPAEAADSRLLGLDELIAAAPESLLGRDVHNDYAALPFLVKLLAAGKPLSVQVHPSEQQAAEGFDVENAAGIGLDDPKRNYRDRAHKPEMIYALSDFAALSGFREAAETAGLFSALLPHLHGAAHAECLAVVEMLNGADPLRATFAHLLGGAAGLAELTEQALLAVAGSAELRREPALAELASLDEHYPKDPGILVSLMLNLVSLAPGEAIYLAAGNVHAYLRGLGVEVMASSDNVLRGGLTSKHIDVPELLKITNFAPQGVPRLLPTTTMYGQEIFAPPFKEFQLQHILLPHTDDAADMADADVPIAANGPVLVVCIEGQLVVDTPRGDLLLRRGHSVFIGANEAPAIARRCVDSGARAFAVTVPPGR